MFVCVSVRLGEKERERERERESERESEVEPGLEERGRRRERLDDDSVCRLHSQSCGSSADGARSSSV